MSDETQDIRANRRETQGKNEIQGQRLSSLRDRAGISPVELSTRTGTTVTEILAIEAGISALSPSRALRLARALDFTYEDLWTGS